MQLHKRKIQGYGYIPDIPDKRDYKYAALNKLVDPSSLPPFVDLRPKCPVVYDQGHLGSCTGNAIAGAIEFDRMKQGETTITPSRLFIYYNERDVEGTVDSDAGAMIRDGIKSVSSQGDCPENLWPYDITKFAQRPNQGCYDEAVKYKALQYQRIDRDLNQFRSCLASGYPFVLGFSVYESFESVEVASTGIMNLPANSEAQVGGHAVMAVGYDDSVRRFIIRNSWGEGWGMSGYFTMPYQYLLDENLSDDFWNITVVK